MKGVGSPERKLLDGYCSRDRGGVCENVVCNAALSWVGALPIDIFLVGGKRSVSFRHVGIVP